MEHQIKEFESLVDLLDELARGFLVNEEMSFLQR